MYVLSRDYNCDSTTIRLRHDDTTTLSTTTEVIEITIRLRYDYDPTTTYRARLLSFDAIRRQQKINMSIFRRSRVVVVSQTNRTQIVISITSLERETCYFHLKMHQMCHGGGEDVLWELTALLRLSS